MVELPASSINYIDVSKLKETEPRLLLIPKILIDGWSKTLDDANNPYSEKHSSALTQFPDNTLQQANFFVREFTVALSMNVETIPMLVSAGNSAGVQKDIVGNAERSGIPVAYGLPKGAESYVQTTKAPILIYDPRPGNESKSRDWGSEIFGEFGLASTDFNVKAVILVGGGPNIYNQLPMYLENQQKAQSKGQIYKIIAIQGVAGSSSKEQIICNLGEDASKNIDFYDFDQVSELIEVIKKLK